MRWILSFMAITFVCLLPAAGVSQVVDGRKIARAELLTDAADFTKPFVVAIRILIEPGWYTYWKNPGDSGLPIEADWILPKGWSVDEVRHPVPQKLVHDNIVSYTYENEAVLLVTINPGRPSRQPLKAKLDWLVCKESCVRGNATVSLDLARLTERQRNAAHEVIEKYRQRLPRERKEAAIQFERATAEMEWAGLQVRIPFKSNLEFSDFYPSSMTGFLIDLSSIRIENGALVFRGTHEGTGTGEIYLSGLFIGSDGNGYESSVPVQFRE